MANEDRKQLNVELPQEVHTRLKVLCVTKGVSLKEFVLVALEEKFKRETGEELAPKFQG